MKSTEPDEVEKIVAILQDFKGKERLLIDMERPLAGDLSANLVVLDDDQLTIPKKNTTVTVVGEVQRQGAHSLRRGYHLDDYLALLAGFTAGADKNALYVVKADGSVMMPSKTNWYRFGSPRQSLEAGDTVVVPIDSAYTDNSAKWRDIIRIIYQAAITVAAVVAFKEVGYFG